MNRISLAENTSVRWLASVLFVLTTFMISMPPARAANPFTVCSDGRPYVWPNGGRQIEFNLDRGPLGLLNEQEARDAFRAAFAVWEAVETSTVSFVEGPELSQDVDGSNWVGFLSDPTTPLSPIIFDDTGEIIDFIFGTGSGVAGVARNDLRNPATCEVIGGYIIVNGTSFATMVHEIGHFSGLGHSTVNAQVIRGDTTGPFPNDTFGRPGPQDENVATMEPGNYFPNGGAGSKATLHADDIASISSLYPTSEFSNTTATIEGSVFAFNGVSRVSGVNVIARNVADPFIDSHSALSGNRTTSTSQSDPFVGTYRIEGLTPGAEYAIYVDEIIRGGFSSPRRNPLPGPEELFNGKRESANPRRDDPAEYTPVVTSAGDVSKDIDVIFNSSMELGGILPLGSDQWLELFLPFTFELCEQEFGSVFVNSSGNLSFGSGRVDFRPTALKFILQQPRIAPLWADLDPEGGTVRFEADKNSFTLFFEDVPEYGSIGTNTFSVTLERAPARVVVNYGTITAQRVITGVSCGGVATSGSEPAVDLSALIPAAIRLHDPAVYESFSSANEFDLEGSEVTIMTKTNFSDRWAGPNDTADHAKKITLPFDSSDIKQYTAISGKGDVDWYRFSANAGTTLIAEALTGSLFVSSEDLDTVFGLYDAATMTELAVDDDSGAGILSRIVYPIVETGEYLLAVGAFPDFDFIGEGTDEGRYVLDLHTIDGLPGPRTEDGATEIPIGFPFPFQGQSWSSVWINANGSLTFGKADLDWTESAAEFLDGIPRIAPLWLDLSPNRGGRVYYHSNADSLVVEFENVPEYGGFGSNTFRAILKPDGSVEFQFDSLSATTGLVGITEGGTVLASSSDLSSLGNFSAAGTTFELFDSSNPFDLEGRVITFTPY